MTRPPYTTISRAELIRCLASPTRQEIADHMLAVTDPENGYLRAFADKHDIPTAEIPMP